MAFKRTVRGYLTWVAFMVATSSILSSCDLVGSGTYKPPFVPVEFVIDTNGNVSVQLNTLVSTPIGDFGVGASAENNVQAPDGGLVMFIQRLVGGQPTDAGFQINENAPVKTLVIDNDLRVQFTGTIYSVNATGHHTILLTTPDAIQQTTDSSTTSSNACQALSDFANAASASVGSNFPDVPFPPGSLSYPISSTYYGSYLSQRVQVCSPGMSPDDVRSFMATNLPSDGWTQSETFPYKGDPSRSCGDPYCWAQSSSPTYYVSLEQVTSRDSVTVYMLRLGTLP